MQVSWHLKPCRRGIMPVTETPVDTKEVPPVDTDIVEPEEEAPLLEPAEPAPQDRVHPLAPGGKRFEQIYAKGKQAEREAQELKERLAAAEARIDVLSGKTTQTAEPEYSWAELETFIQQGRITRADAEAHRESVLTRNLTKQITGEFTTKTHQATRSEALTRTIQDYVGAVPAIAVDGSEDRIRLDEEFDFLANVQGLDPAKVDDAKRKELQVIALRNVYGPIDSVRTRSAPPKVEPNQGLPGGTPPAQRVNKDQEIIDKLTKTQVAHYRKMMAAGRYRGGWKDVVAEIKWERKKPGGR